MDYWGFMFSIFFVTLGPLKTIPVFYMLTYEAGAKYRIGLAFRSTVVATAVVLFVALSTANTLQKWHVSVHAVTIAGGIILFVTALKAVTGFNLVEPPPARPPEEKAAPGTGPRPTAKLTWLGKPVISPLVVPTIVTPAGVVAVLFFLAKAGEHELSHQAVLLMLLLMMLLNLVGMLLAAPIMRIVGLSLLQLVGWIFAVLQAALAVQAVLEALRRLQIIP